MDGRRAGVVRWFARERIPGGVSFYFIFDGFDMKSFLAILVAVPFLFSSFGAVAQSKYQKEANSHYKQQQQSRETRRQTDNRTVNNYSQRNYSNSQRSSSYRR